MCNLLCHKQLRSYMTATLVTDFLLQLVPGNFGSGRGVIPSLAGLEEQSCQRGYYQFGM
jgi:hypothetical protein